jgi:putative Mg2+ transporter-C (MgtC) family protein
MDYLNEIINSTEINTGTTLLRLGFSFVAGALIGYEREAHRQPAGIKTHMLICIGSTLVMLLSIYIPQTYQNFQNGDPGRIAAQVISGIGFIGAGAILRMGINVRGLTTAASIWAVAAIGLAIGAGMFLPATLAVGLILIVLIVVEQLEKYFFTPLNLKIIAVKTSSPYSDLIVRNTLEQNHFRIIEIIPAYFKDESYGYTYKVGFSQKNEWVELTHMIVEADTNILSIEIYDPKT